MTLDWADLPRCFPDLVGAERWLPLLQRHAAILEAEAEAVPTSSVEPGEVVRRHYAESLELLRIVTGRFSDGPAVDVGPGGGFPGIVFAVACPGLSISLVEPLKKRARLLERIAAELDLENVEIVPLRAEEAGRTTLRERAVLVTARAVAPLPELLEYCAPLAVPGGLLALPKGQDVGREVEMAAAALRILACEVEEVVPMRQEVSATPYTVLVRKVGLVPERYPRRPGMVRKRPLGAR